MDNLINFNQTDFEPYNFCYPEEEERKVHTPYVEPQDFSMENSEGIKPISSKIQFTLSDMAMAKKAKSRKTKTIEDPNSNKKCGHWSCEQNKRYHWFLELHHEHFFNKHLRRTDRIFKSMASFVQTRQAEQCRSHHQKMQKKYKYFSKILMSLRHQNYNSQETDPILDDMSRKGHNITQVSIMPAQQLRNFSESWSSEEKQPDTTPVRTPKSKILKSQNTTTTLPSSSVWFQEVADEENKQPQQEFFGPLFQRQDELENIFNDTYEKNFDLGTFF